LSGFVTLTVFPSTSTSVNGDATRPGYAAAPT
jgi:hypothetical protein